MYKGMRTIAMLMLLVMLAGCVYTQKPSEAPSEMPTQSGAPTPAPSETPSKEVVEAASWKDEVQLASKVRLDNQHTAVRPNPYWASTIMENEGFVYYVTKQGIKQLNKETQEQILLHESSVAYRIWLDENILYIWEMQPYGPYGTLQKKGTISSMDLQTQAIKTLWEFDTEFINRRIDEFVDEGAIYENHLYLYEAQNQKWSSLVFSIDLGDTKSSKYWPEYSFMEERNEEITDGAFKENKIYYVRKESDDERGNYTQLIEQDLLKEESRIIWETPKEGQTTLMKGVVAYKGTLYATVCDEKKPSDIQLVMVDGKTGVLSEPVATVKSISADIDFVVEESGLYMGALTSDSYILYWYDEDNKTARQIYASPDRLVSFRVVHGTVFYGSNQGVEHVALEK